MPLVGDIPFEPYSISCNSMIPKPALAAPTVAASGLPVFPGPKALPLALPKFIVPVEALFTPAAPFPPMAIPVTVTVAVD